MDSVSSRVLMAAAGGREVSIWGPAYLHGVVGKIAKVQTAEQPETLVAVGQGGLLWQRDVDGGWSAVVMANNGAAGGFGDFTDIVSNGTAIVATTVNGNLGIVASTTLAGLSLYSSFSFGGPTNIQSVAWSPSLNLFVAIGGSGVYLSESGFSWTGPSGPGGTSVVWTGSAFLAAAGNSVYRSADGLTWEYLTTPSLPNGNYQALRYFALDPSGYAVVLLGVDAYGNGIFSYTGNNGDFWTQLYGWGSTGRLVDIAGPGPFNTSFPTFSNLRVLGSNGNVYNMGGTLVSDTGSYLTSTLYWDSSVGYLVGGGFPGASCVLKGAATDVGPWERVSPSPEYTLKALAWDGTRFIAMGYGIDVYSSTDGLSWDIVSTIPVPAPTPSVPLSFNSVEDLVWTGTFFCGVGQRSASFGQGGRIVRSADGFTWTSLSESAAGYEEYRAVGWSGSVLCAVGGNTRISTSNDGLSWTNRTPPNITRNLFGVAFGNSTWVAVGEAGKVLTAAEAGVTWTDRTLGASTNLSSVAFGNGLFVAVGGISVYTSPNGILWTLRSQPETVYALTSVTWTGAEFVAVFTGGQVISSPDGVTWQTVLALQTEEEASAKIKKRTPLYKVRSGGRTLVAVGDCGSVTKNPRPATPPFPKA